MQKYAKENYEYMFCPIRRVNTIDVQDKSIRRVHIIIYIIIARKTHL